MNLNGILSEQSHVVVVAGMDATATTRTAMAIARNESSARKVVMIDLWGNLPEIEQLAGDHDGHGISDVLFCGVSPTRVMRAVNDSSSLYVVTSGNDLAPAEVTLVAKRWGSLRAHFRAGPDLMLLVSRGDTEGLSEFCAQADSALLCGNGFEISAANTVRILDEDRDETTIAPPSSSPPAPPAASPKEARISRGVQGLPGTLILLLALFGGGLIFLSQRGYFGGGSPDSSSVQLNSPALSGALVAPLATEIPAIANPDDSSFAAGYSVEIAVLNTRAGAEMRLAELRGIRGSTISPVVSDAGETWYRVFAGAFSGKNAADSLQADLRFKEIQMSDGDRIVNHPIALRLGIYTPAFRTSAEEALARYISLGVPAYILEQPDGSLFVYAGAFDSVQQAMHLHDICANMGMTPRMVYRTGR